MPQVYEIPKEHQKRLSDINQIEIEVDPELGKLHKQVYYQQPICSVLNVVNDTNTLTILKNMAQSYDD